ncbi:hypothetical protein VNO77_03855 [Canavalia gladiata]|uniref:Uncharacterized protein n=1 Tax=Canavalia gladiata TaxID=3824 RepID=A0AAN9R774_CANGL
MCISSEFSSHCMDECAYVGDVVWPYEENNHAVISRMQCVGICITARAMHVRTRMVLHAIHYELQAV